MTNKDLLLKIKENECCLIGQIPLNEEEINSIMLYAKNIIGLEDKYIVDGPDLILSTALVQVAINEYQDGKYWEYLKNKFNTANITMQKQLILGKIFIKTLREYKLFELNLNDNGTMRYVENIKAHAFVTNNYMEGFFDFLNDYYENNLFRNISDGVEDTLQDLSDYMKTTMKQSSDMIYSEDNGKTKKAYKLLKSTREVIAQCSGNILYKLFYPSLKIIDNRFYDGILPENTSDRFSKIFIEWDKKKNIKNNENSKKFIERRNYSHKPYLTLNLNKYVRNPFTLVIPKRRFRPSECNGKADLKLTINNMKRPIKHLEVNRIMGTYISEEFTCPITYPFDQIKVEIESLENFEIEISQCNFAIFNENCIRVNKFEKGINYLLVKPDVNVKFSDEKVEIETEILEEWIQYKLNVLEDTICYINNKPITILGEFSKEPIFEKEISFFNIYDEENNKIIGARAHPLISFELDKNKIKGTTIQINEKNYSLFDKNVILYDSVENKNKLIISVDLSKILPSINGYFRVDLNIPGENNKLITEYLLLKNVYFIFDKMRYINENEAKLTLKTDGIDIKILDDTCDIVYSNEYRNNYYYNVKLNSKYRFINAKMTIENKLFYINVPIRMMLYGFSESNLSYGDLSSKIWYSKLQPLIYVKLPGANKLGIYSNVDYNKIIWGNQIAEEMFIVNISVLIDDINASNKMFQYLYIKYVDSKERWMPLFVVEKSVQIKPYFELEFYNEIPCFNINFNEITNVKIFYSIKESDSNREIIHHRELKSGINYLPEIKRNVYYNIFPTIEEIDEFGLNKKEKFLPIKKYEGIISYVQVKDNILHSKFFINNIIYNGSRIDINRLYKYKIEIQSKEKDYYYGTIFEVEYFAKFNNIDYLIQKNQRTMGDIRIQIINQDKDDEINLTMENFSKMDNEWYEFYYNKESKRLIENDNSILDKITSNKVINLECSSTTYIIKVKGDIR